MDFFYSGSAADNLLPHKDLALPKDLWPAFHHSRLPAGKCNPAKKVRRHPEGSGGDPRDLCGCGSEPAIVRGAGYLEGRVDPSGAQGFGAVVTRVMAPWE